MIRAALLGLTAIVFLPIVAQAQADEPIHKGRPLKEWIADLKSENANVREKAALAWAMEQAPSTAAKTGRVWWIAAGLVVGILAGAWAVTRLRPARGAARRSRADNRQTATRASKAPACPPAPAPKSRCRRSSALRSARSRAR